MEHKQRHLLERSSCFSPSFIRKPQINSKGVLIREIPTQVSQASKKRRAEDMAKKILMKQKKQRKLIFNEDSMDDKVVPESPFGSGKMDKSSHVSGSLVKSNPEAIGNPNENVEASKVD